MDRELIIRILRTIPGRVMYHATTISYIQYVINPIVEELLVTHDIPYWISTHFTQKQIRYIPQRIPLALEKVVASDTPIGKRIPLITYVIKLLVSNLGDKLRIYSKEYIPATILTFKVSI